MRATPAVPRQPSRQKALTGEMATIAAVNDVKVMDFMLRSSQGEKNRSVVL